MVTNYQWQPGNGSNYDINVVHGGLGKGDTVLLCWMFRGGSGGSCMQFQRGGFLHYTYLSEKMELDGFVSDAAAILALVAELGLSEVGMPDGFGPDGLNERQRQSKEAYRNRFGHTGLEPQLKKGDPA